MIRRAAQAFSSHRYGLTLVSHLAAAVLSGLVCVGFMRAFDVVIDHRLDFLRIGAWTWVTTPVCFLAAWAAIRRFAPEADGTGIPQAVYAATHATGQNESKLMPLFSWRTFAMKGLCLLAGVWACASTGREGPSVQMSACVFVGTMMILRKTVGARFDFRSAVIAGSAAGLAAAFNTPLAGVTFAIEELSTDYFAAIKEITLIAIIVAAIAAQSLTGEYTYFGKLMEPADLPVLAIIAIAVVGGAAGALFSWAILKGGRYFRSLSGLRFGWLVPIMCGLALVALGAASSGRAFGPGNNVANDLLANGWRPFCLTYPLEKTVATLLTFWSGIAGGIFAPCLAAGAALGAEMGHFLGLATATCAIVGMVAFLSGTIQAPVTSFVIIFEMTGNHRMLLPVMLASVTAVIVARLLGAHHLYQGLSQRFAYLLEPRPAAR